VLCVSVLHDSLVQRSPQLGTDGGGLPSGGLGARLLRRSLLGALVGGGCRPLGFDDLRGLREGQSAGPNGSVQGKGAQKRAPKWNV
jgi:hypothetical protein